MKFVDIGSSNTLTPINENFTTEEHMEYVLAAIHKAWKLILRYENPQKISHKIKQPPLSELSEDDLKRKIVLNICQKFEDSLEGRSYSVSAEEQLTGAEPDIVLGVRTSKVSVKLDIECKKSKNDLHSAKQYRSEGVERFTSNKYDRSGHNVGGMIAFALNDENNRLDDIIRNLRDATDINRIAIFSTSFDGSQMFISEHQRTATHHTIRIRHLVLNCR
ncbi:hypothetical protein [Cellvibrio sp. OA-2007]|uniref:hypothetical protein n=1 Tax=Cellvibrio sp. OA-2007 TaxID=529823 RepID=UPI000783CF61|nr:hypothetical protein [Cellvibrio sp. OA-2007]